MPNVAKVLKDEIARISRKEAKESRYWLRLLKTSDEKIDKPLRNVSLLPVNDTGNPTSNRRIVQPYAHHKYTKF